MMKIVAFLIIFILILFTGDRLISLFLGKLVTSSQNRFVNIYKDGMPDDIVILGNSRADRHFPPNYLSNILKKNITNLGLGGIPTLLEKELLKDYIEKKGAPKLLILEITNLIVPPSKIGDMRLFCIYSERIRDLTKKYNRKLYYTDEVFHLFRFNNEIFFRVLSGIKHKQNDRVRKSIIDESLIRKITTKPPVAIENYTANETALKEIINLANNYHIQLRLVITPYLPVLKFTNYNSWKSSLIKDITGDHKLWDYSRYISDQKYFSDSYHLNVSGVRIMLQKMEDDKLFNF